MNDGARDLVEVVPGVFASMRVVRAACSESGHSWSLWLDRGTHLIRWCQWCGLREERVANDDVRASTREGG